MPQISVIVPVYKVQDYLKECVDSILSQTFKDFELILVDDGSPDNCPNICDEYALNDERVVVIHKENGGLSSARNAGLDYVFANSDSQFVSFIDSDDYVDKKFLEELILAIEEHTISVCRFASVHKNKIIYDNFSDCVFLDYPKTVDVNKLDTFWLVVWNKLYKKEVFNNLRFPEGKKLEDGYTIHRIYGECETVIAIPDNLYYYRQRNDSIMGTIGLSKRQYELEISLDKAEYYREKQEENLFKINYFRTADLLIKYYKDRKEIPTYQSVLKKFKKIKTKKTKGLSLFLVCPLAYFLIFKFVRKVRRH